MKSITIFLTGCIKPNTKEGLAVKDITVRRQQYINAINWYLANTPYKIVFCENSGTDISGDFRFGGGRIEFLTYTSTPLKIDYGKGLREMEILEYAIAHSAFLKNSDIIIKGTGRLILKNIVKVASWLEKQNTKDFCSSWMSIKKGLSDSRFFFCSPNFLKLFASYKDRLNDKLNFEKLLATCIRENHGKFRFIYPPVWYNIEGIGGGLGSVYHFTRWQYYKLNIKNVFYYIAFNWFKYWPKKLDI